MDQWDLGDLWRARPDGTDADASAAAAGLTTSTLFVLGWVAGIFPAGRRRRISHTHHIAVANLPAPVADALLDQAVAERWTVARIREAARKERETEAARADAAKQRRLDLSPLEASWRADAWAVEQECRKRLVAAEAGIRAALDALEALAAHPGAEHVHGNRRQATVKKLQGILAPGGTGIDLTQHFQPTLDRIWTHPAVAQTREASRG